MSTSTSKIFADRLSDLIEENRQNGGDYRQISKDTEISTGALSNYANDVQQPNISKLVAIANFFNVSTDYLLGLSNDPDRLPSATDDLGLSAKAVRKIRQHRLFDNQTFIHFFNLFLESELFDRFMYDLYLCCQVNVAEEVYCDTASTEFDPQNIDVQRKEQCDRVIELANSGMYTNAVSDFLRQMVRFDQQQDHIDDQLSSFECNFGREIIPRIIEQNAQSSFEALKKDIAFKTSFEIREAKKNESYNKDN